MKLKYFFLLLTITSLSTLFGQQNDTYDELIDKAFDYYSSKKYELSVAHYEKAFKIRDKNSDDLYNAACSASLNNELKKATTFLKSAIDNGWTNADYLQEDTDLDNLHSTRSWKKIVKKATQKEEESKLENYQVSDKINDLIISNKGKTIYKLATDNFKSEIKLANLKTTVNLLYNLLEENNINSMGDIKTSSSSSTSYVNGVKSENIVFNYELTPKYLDRKLEFTFKSVGYQIKIELSKENEQWLLSTFDVDNQYATPDYKMNTTIDNFLRKTDSLHFIGNKNRGTIKSGFIRTKILNEFKNLEYIPLSELSNMTFDKKSEKKFRLSFKSNKKTSTLFNKESNIVNTIEFMFYYDELNLIFISNGVKYAAYKTPSAEFFAILAAQISAITENRLD